MGASPPPAARRLARIHHHLLAPSPPPPGPQGRQPPTRPAAAAVKGTSPWTDEQVQRFIVEGVCMVESTTLPASHHEAVLRQAEALMPTQLRSADVAPADTVWADEQRLSGHSPDGKRFYLVSTDEHGEERMGNVVNYDHDNSEGSAGRALQDNLDAVFDSPEVRACLTATLGRNYVMDGKPHVAQLSSVGDRPGQQWHKGGNAKRRHHLPTFCFGFYFPVDVDLEIGPTHALTRSQYYINAMPIQPQHPDATAVLDQPGQEEAVEYLGTGLMSDTAFGVLRVGTRSFGNEHLAHRP